jgi:hypothetical protein
MVLGESSVETNLLCFVNTLMHTMESGRQTDVVYTDFRKAYGSVNPSVLIAKLCCLVYMIRCSLGLALI